MASIREVAKRAGVAACTVSRVLNGTVAVSPETRQKIEKAMEELDYIPNELARGMFRRKAGIIAMLVPSINHPFFSSLADCIERSGNCTSRDTSSCCAVPPTMWSGSGNI